MSSRAVVLSIGIPLFREELGAEWKLTGVRTRFPKLRYPRHE